MGGILGGDLKPFKGNLEELINCFDKVIMKPTIESMGGSGIKLFSRTKDGLKSGDIVRLRTIYSIMVAILPFRN